jgi:hypothetical protein
MLSIRSLVTSASNAFLVHCLSLFRTRISPVNCSPSLGHSVLCFESSQKGVWAKPLHLSSLIVGTTVRPCRGRAAAAVQPVRGDQSRRGDAGHGLRHGLPPAHPHPQEQVPPATQPPRAVALPRSRHFFASFAIYLSSLFASKHLFGPPVLSRISNSDFNGYFVYREPLPSLVCSNVYGPRQFPEKVRLSVARPSIAEGCRQYLTERLRALHSRLEPCWYRTC